MERIVARSVQFRQGPYTFPPHELCNRALNQELKIAPVNYAKIIGERIFRARKTERNWTREELSRRTEGRVSASQINNYERGERMLGPQEAVLLAQALDARPAYFLGVDDVQTQINTQEEALIRNWRSLPENERMETYRQLEQKAMLYRDPVPDARLEGFSAKDKPMPKQIAAKRVKR